MEGHRPSAHDTESVNDHDDESTVHSERKSKGTGMQDTEATPSSKMAEPREDSQSVSCYPSGSSEEDSEQETARPHAKYSQMEDLDYKERSSRQKRRRSANSGPCETQDNSSGKAGDESEDSDVTENLDDDDAESSDGEVDNSVTAEGALVASGPKASRRKKNTLQTKWEHMFARLISFREKHGHCLVPNRYSIDHSLGAWVSTQRRQYKIMTSGDTESTPMTPRRADRLNALGFVWSTTDPRHIPWEQRFSELKEYKQKFGNTCVPIGYKENPQLGNWVSTQRQEMRVLKLGRNSRLDERRIQKLIDIDFLWEAPRGGSRKRVIDGVTRPETDGKRRYKKAKETMVQEQEDDGQSDEAPLGPPVHSIRDPAGTYRVGRTGNETSNADISSLVASRLPPRSHPRGANPDDRRQAWEDLQAALSESVNIHAALDNNLANDLGLTPSWLMHALGRQPQGMWQPSLGNTIANPIRNWLNHPVAMAARQNVEQLSGSLAPPSQNALLPLTGHYLAQGGYQGLSFMPNVQNNYSGTLMSSRLRHQHLGSNVQQQQAELATRLPLSSLLLPGVQPSSNVLTNQLLLSHLNRYPLRTQGMHVNPQAAASTNFAQGAGSLSFADLQNSRIMTTLEQRSTATQRLAAQRQVDIASALLAARRFSERSERNCGDVCDDAADDA